MPKIIGLTVIILLETLLSSSIAFARSNFIDWKITVDQKQVPENYHITTSFIDASNNTALGSTEVSYPTISAYGEAYVKSVNDDRLPIGYIRASLAKLAGNAKDLEIYGLFFPLRYIQISLAQLLIGVRNAEFYSVNCYDLNGSYEQKAYLNFPQDFTHSKPKCGK